MIKHALPLPKVYALLEPGPVLLLTTMHKGRADVMTMSWHTMLQFEPPMVGCVAGRNDISRDALRKTRQCVLNIPTVDLAAKVVACGNASGRDTDKFAAFGLAPKPATLCAAPLIAECFASLECRVIDTRFVNRYAFFVLEVLKAWMAPGCKNARTLHHRGYGAFMVAGETTRLPSKMR
ncbi:MAG: flavin reductase family protein [Burkholderiales bacterium]